MSKRIIHHLENPAQAEEQHFSDERVTVTDLVFPGTGYKFSDEFACVLRVLAAERDFA